MEMLQKTQVCGVTGESSVVISFPGLSGKTEGNVYIGFKHHFTERAKIK